MEQPDTPAAPAPAATQTPSDVLANLSPAETLEWRKTGEIPVKPPPSDPEPLPPTEDDEPEPDDAEPEPAAAVPARTVSKRQQQINDKIRQGVEAELARRAALTPPTPAAIPPPAPVAEDDPEPNPTDLATYPGGEYDPRYTRDVNRWDARQDRKKEAAEAQTRASRAQADTSFRTSVKATADAFAARGQADPTFQSSLDTTLMEALIPISQLPAGMPAQPINVIAQQLLDNPDTAPDVALYLSKNPAELARLTARDASGVPVLSIPRLIREIGRLEAGLNRTAPPPPTTITSAPPPPTTLGDRAAAPADPVDSAVRRKDFGAYQREANARELAGRAK